MVVFLLASIFSIVSSDPFSSSFLYSYIFSFIVPSPFPLIFIISPYILHHAGISHSMLVPLSSYLKPRTAEALAGSPALLHQWPHHTTTPVRRSVMQRLPKARVKATDKHKTKHKVKDKVKNENKHKVKNKAKNKVKYNDEKKGQTRSNKVSEVELQMMN